MSLNHSFSRDDQTPQSITQVMRNTHSTRLRNRAFMTLFINTSWCTIIPAIKREEVRCDFKKHTYGFRIQAALIFLLISKVTFFFLEFSTNHKAKVHCLVGRC